MGLFDWGKKTQKVDTTTKINWVEIDDNGRFYHYINKMLKGNEIQRFDNCLSFHFASTIAEVFIPIDIISDRVSSVDYILTNKNTGLPIENIPLALENLIKKPNPTSTFGQLVYDIVFSELATGGSYTVTKFPSTVKTKIYDRITNIWSLNPDETKACLYRSIPDPLMVKELSELIEKYRTRFIVDLELGANEVYFNNISKLTKELDPISPLNACYRNIDNLIAVYSARFNVYEKNGVAGIVYKDAAAGDSILEQTDPVTRETILDEISKREGITGDRNFTSISSQKLGFIDTLGKIKDLQPFDETQADTLAIGVTYGVDKELLSQKDGTTFANKKDAEKQLWQNRVMPYCHEVAKTLTKVYYLPEDWHFVPNFDNVDILRQDDKIRQETETIEIDNIVKLKELGVNTDKHLEKWKL